MLSVRDFRRFPLSCGSGLFRISHGNANWEHFRRNTGKYNFKYAGKFVIPDLRLSFQAIQLSSSCMMFYPCVPCSTGEVPVLRTPCGHCWPQLDMLHSPSGFPFRISRGIIGCGLWAESSLYPDFSYSALIFLPTPCSRGYLHNPTSEALSHSYGRTKSFLVVTSILAEG